MIEVMTDVLNENLDFVRNSQGSVLRKIGPNWVNNIGDWIFDEGYLVKMFGNGSFTITGTQVEPSTPISLAAGFQFVSYLPTSAMDALVAFGTIVGDDLAFVRDSQGSMLRKIGPNWVNGIGDCQPDEGYLIKMFADGVLIYPGSSSFTCGDPFTDPRDEQTYTTVQIGNQCWMAENLNVGTMINGSVGMTNNEIIEKYCHSNNNANCNEYGGLYQWDEMMQYVTTAGTQGICPTGWHLPTDAEWKTMEMHLGMSQDQADATGWRGTDEGGKLKETGTTHWASPNTGATNTSGFTGLPGGYRYTNGSFTDLTFYAYFWSSSENGSDAWYRGLSFGSAQVGRYDYDKAYGFSVRCVRD